MHLLSVRSLTGCAYPTVLELCCGSCPSDYTCTDSDDCAQAFVNLVPEHGNVSAVCALTVGSIFPQHAHWGGVSVSQKCAVTCGTCNVHASGCFDSPGLLGAEYTDCTALLSSGDDATCFSNHSNADSGIESTVASICRRTCNACCDDTVPTCLANGTLTSAAEKRAWCVEEYVGDGSCDGSCQRCPVAPQLPPATMSPDCRDRTQNCPQLVLRYGCNVPTTLNPALIPIIERTTRDLCPASCNVLRCFPPTCVDQQPGCMASVRAGLPCERVTSNGAQSPMQL